MLSCARIFRHTQANGQAQQLCGCWAEGVGVSLREANIVQQWVGSGLRVTLRGICNQLCPSMRGLVFGGATSPKPPPFYITGGHFPPRPPRHLLLGALPPNPRCYACGRPNSSCCWAGTTSVIPAEGLIVPVVRAVVDSFLFGGNSMDFIITFLKKKSNKRSILSSNMGCGLPVSCGASQQQPVGSGLCHSVPNPYQGLVSALQAFVQPPEGLTVGRMLQVNYYWGLCPQTPGGVYNS